MGSSCNQKWPLHYEKILGKRNLYAWAFSVTHNITFGTLSSFRFVFYSAQHTVHHLS